MTPKQQRFVEEYLVDLNATQAAIRAGYSEKTASQQGEQLLKKLEIAQAVEAAMSERAERVEIEQDRVLKELARLGFSDLRNVFTEDGGLKHPATWDDATAASIASVEVVTRRLPGAPGEGVEVEYVHKIKSWDKPRALEMIGRHLAMFTDKLESKHDVSDALSEVLKAVAERGGRIGR